MTIDEAIKHCLEVAEQKEHESFVDRWSDGDEWSERIQEDCRQCAADHRQIAEWLMELKDLRNSLGAVKLKDMKEAARLLQELNTENNQFTSQLAEAKRLLKAAVEDLAKIPCNNDVYIPSSCDACIKQGNCDYSDSFKWRYADEALKLIES